MSNENTVAAAPRKISLASVVILLSVVLIAGASIWLLATGIGSAALDSARGIVRGVQHRWDDSYSEYAEAQETLAAIELPEGLSFGTLDGLTVRKLCTQNAIELINAGYSVVQQGVDVSVRPYNRLKKAADAYNAYKTHGDYFNALIKPYGNEDLSEFTIDDPTELFAALDKYFAEHPEAPAWINAQFKTYVAQIAGTPAEDVLPFFAEALKSDDGLWMYADMLLNYYYQLDMTDESIALFDRMIALNRNDASAMLDKGRLYLRGDISTNEKLLKDSIKQARKYAKDTGVAEALEIGLSRRTRNLSDALSIAEKYVEKCNAQELYPEVEALYQYTIALLLNDEAKQAEETILLAVDILQDKQQSLNGAVYYLIGLSATLAGDEEFMTTNKIELNDAAKAVVNAPDKKAALEQLFYEGVGELT
ncbi:MAG: hypothetical protein LBN05_02800 [Oscillospiraceae bacterium]|jgi:tetratricopeptide (TPR) repeat protein|nr:hypothetical protein [Oscillospiraceae bacterium]